MSNSNGIIIYESPYPVKETADYLQATLEQRNATIYARIDQQQELQKVGQTIPPLEFLLFGNPKSGGPVMAENPLAALDLPLKIIIWQDAQGKTQVAFNDAAYIQNRHHLTAGVSGALHLNSLVTEILS